MRHFSWAILINRKENIVKIYTKKEWEREQYKGQWSDCPYNRDEVASGKLPAYYIGRRYVMIGGERGPMLITEGVHFLVEGDYSHLPTLHKSNALVGAMYRNGDGCFKLNRLYRITEEYAREHELTCLERVDTTAGDFALPGGDRLQEGCLRSEKFIGMNFRDWCALDRSDTRKIVYTINGFWDDTAHEEHFTSEDLVSFSMIGKIQEAHITRVELVNNEWVVALCYNEGCPKYVKTADGYIGVFVRDDIELGLLYRFPGGMRYADAWEVAHGSNDRAELEKEVQE